MRSVNREDDSEEGSDDQDHSDREELDMESMKGKMIGENRQFPNDKRGKKNVKDILLGEGDKDTEKNN